MPLQEFDVIIDIPKHIENDFDRFAFFSQLFNELSNIKEKKVIFKFNKTTWFEANLVSVFASLIELSRVNECKVSLFGVSNSIKTIFRKNGFYTHYNLGEVDDAYNTTIPFKKFDCEDEEGFTQYLNEEVIPKIQLPLTALQIRRFKNCLQEVFVNVGIHANSNYVFTCGQYYYKGEKVAFTITDIGRTIGSNVRRKITGELQDCDAIDWATQFGNTTKYDEEGGIGLNLIKTYMCNNGIFQIISGDGYWEQNQGDVNYKTMDTYFGGTIVNIISDLSKPVHFKESQIKF